jgi:hypothetical protein
MFISQRGTGFQVAGSDNPTNLDTSIDLVVLLPNHSVYVAFLEQMLAKKARNVEALRVVHENPEGSAGTLGLPTPAISSMLLVRSTHSSVLLGLGSEIYNDFQCHPCASAMLLRLVIFMSGHFQCLWSQIDASN